MDPLENYLLFRPKYIFIKPNFNIDNEESKIKVNLTLPIPSLTSKRYNFYKSKNAFINSEFAQELIEVRDELSLNHEKGNKLCLFGYKHRMRGNLQNSKIELENNTFRSVKLRKIITKKIPIRNRILDLNKSNKFEQDPLNNYKYKSLTSSFNNSLEINPKINFSFEKNNFKDFLNTINIYENKSYGEDESALFCKKNVESFSKTPFPERVLDYKMKNRINIRNYHTNYPIIQQRILPKIRNGFNFSIFQRHNKKQNSHSYNFSYKKN